MFDNPKHLHNSEDDKDEFGKQTLPFTPNKDHN